MAAAFDAAGLEMPPIVAPVRKHIAPQTPAGHQGPGQALAHASPSLAIEERVGVWHPRNRACQDRGGLRYPSDLTDQEWSAIAPVIPPSRRGGNKRTVDIREVVNGVLYILATGCQWRAMPEDLPPRSTVNGYLHRWTRDGTLGPMHRALNVSYREQNGEAGCPALTISRQCVTSADRDRMLPG